MFKIIQKTIATGIVTTKYPGEPLKSPSAFAGGRASTSKNGRMRGTPRRYAQPERFSYAMRVTPGESRSITVCAFSAACVRNHPPIRPCKSPKNLSWQVRTVVTSS